MATVEYKKCLSGREPDIQHWTVGATAVKQGDPCKIGASANLLIPITAAADVVIGVATHDAAIGAQVAIIPANGDTVFRIKCSSTKKYVAASDKYTLCDFDTFTSGAMSIDPATDVGHSVRMLDLSPDSVNDTNGNYALCIFNLRILDK